MIKVQSRSLTRREFLYYLWGASIALSTASVASVIGQIALPRFKPAEDCFDFCYVFPVSQLPPPDGAPIKIAHLDRSAFWLAHIGIKDIQDARHPDRTQVQSGLLALDAVCPQSGCQYEWGKAVEAFICPCDGSSFLKDGSCINGPATHGLNKFIVTIMDGNGRILDQNYNGRPIAISETASVIGVNTMFRVLGQSER